MHLGHPVPQRVHDQPQRDRVPGVERVAGAGRVVVLARVAVDQPVVRRVVQPAVTQRRAALAALAGVVEHHVQDDLQACLVQRPDHGLELGHLPAALPGPHRGGIALVRREVPEGVVAPVVGQASLEEVLGYILVHRQQFDRGDAEPGQVLDDRLVRQPGVGAAQRLGHIRMTHGQALDVRLVDDRVRHAPRGGRPTRTGVSDEPRGTCPRSPARSRVLVGRVVVKHLRPERDLAVHARAYGSSSSLAGLQRSPRRVPGPVHPVPVGLPGADARNEPVPDAVVVFGQLDPPLGPGLIEQAQLDRVGDAGRHREVGSPVTRRRP